MKMIASHGGGTLPYLVGRFDMGDKVEIPSRRRMKAKPSEYLKRIWYDCINYHPGALQFMISVVGADRVLYGTDYPHQVHDMKGSYDNTAALPPDVCRAVREGNARKIFAI
jgi:aminocarboxymuconate-semialdehyde decarboxylase